jgi:hypothetical protein
MIFEIVKAVLILLKNATDVAPCRTWLALDELARFYVDSQSK